MSVSKRLFLAIFVLTAVSCSSDDSNGIPMNDSSQFPVDITGLWVWRDAIYLQLTRPLSVELWTSNDSLNCYDYLQENFTALGGNRYADGANDTVEMTRSATGLDFATLGVTIPLVRATGLDARDIPICNFVARTIDSQNVVQGISRNLISSDALQLNL